MVPKSVFYFAIQSAASNVSVTQTWFFFSISGFLLDKKIGVNQPKRIENAKILIANTGMDTDKIKVGDF